MAQSPLVPLHDASSLSRPKMDQYGKLSTPELIDSLQRASPDR
jgi:hypothetical protein